MAAATAERPPRAEPHPYEIARYWLERADAGDEWPDFHGRYIGLGEPFCFRCDWLPPVDTDGDARAGWKLANCWLDRAHLVDRSSDGLDGPQNLVMLCQLCHDRMPSFSVNEGAQALAWVIAGHEWPQQSLWQLHTDGIGADLPRLRGARLRFLELLAAGEAA